QGVQKVFERFGLEGVFTLGANTSFHFCIRIGECLAKLQLLPAWQQLLPEKLVSADEHERAIALGYAAGRRDSEGDAWVERIPLEEWSAEEAGEFALIFNFERQTWEMLRRRKPEAEKFYWRRVRPWVVKLTDGELEETVSALLQNGRPMAAVDA